MSILGVDVGGTFTDVVLLADGELRNAKVPTARSQEESVLAATAGAGLPGTSSAPRCWGRPIRTRPKGPIGRRGAVL
jgi:N-methylhydantoinase A/oxoprolinase/acetone carboxylase beta subunit